MNFVVYKFWFYFSIQLDAMGRPDESLNLEVRGPFHPLSEENMIGKMFSFSFQKGHLKANVCYQPLHSANLEVLPFIPCLEWSYRCLIKWLILHLLSYQVRHLPLDELELASLRGTIQRVIWLRGNNCSLIYSLIRNFWFSYMHIKEYQLLLLIRLEKEKKKSIEFVFFLLITVKKGTVETKLLNFWVEIVYVMP